jgi:hypothetical protein
MTVWYSLWSFGVFSDFGTFGPRRIWQPCLAFARERSSFRSIQKFPDSLFLHSRPCRTFFTPEENILTGKKVFRLPGNKFLDLRNNFLALFLCGKPRCLRLLGDGSPTHPLRCYFTFKSTSHQMQRPLKSPRKFEVGLWAINKFGINRSVF